MKKTDPKSESEDVKMSSLLKDQGQSKCVTTSAEASDKQIKPESDQKKNSIVASSVKSKEQDENPSSIETKAKHAKQKVSISSTFYAKHVFCTKFWRQKLQSFVLAL